MAEVVKFECVQCGAGKEAMLPELANAHGLDEGFYVFRCCWCGTVGNPWEVTASSGRLPRVSPN